MKTLVGALEHIAENIRAKTNAESGEVAITKLGAMQNIVNALNDVANAGDSKTAIGALESIADAVEDMDIGGGFDVAGLIDKSIEGEVIVPEGITVIGENVFSGCVNMTGIIIPEGVEDIRHGAFNGCTAIKEIVTPESCKRINAGNYSGMETFTGTAALEKAIFSGVTSFNAHNSTQFGGAGANSESLFIYFPKLLEADDKLLNGSLVTKCYMPAVTKVGSTFAGCSKLAEVYIGPNCTSIYAGAFGGAKSGIVINCGFAEGAVSGAPWGATNATINYNVPVPEVED